MKIRKFQIPKTRDPFINSLLIKAGKDPISGEERFWISTWNANVGCIGALVTENGDSRIYRFEKPGKGFICCGAYSACMTDNDTIWMMGDLAGFVKLTLSTGEYEIYETGAPFFSMMCTDAMQYDEKSGKIMAIAFGEEGMKAVSYDTVNKKTVKIYDFSSSETCCKGSFANGDGTYTFRFVVTEPSLYKWDPQNETLEKKVDICDYECHGEAIRDEAGRVYIPYSGWLTTSDYSFWKENLPETEKNWFEKQGKFVYGYSANECGNDFYKWDIESGKVEKFFFARDYGESNITSDGHILNVSVAGELCKFTSDGKEVFSKMLDSDSQTVVDCVIKVDDKTIIGTPFITQRFWIMDTETGNGFDAGRATPGVGEVLRCWNIRDKIYLASYAEGYLVEFDPKKKIEFPQNPRIVTKAPAMRPVADARKGDVLYYACTNKYGKLGCTLTKYNVVSGEAVHIEDPMFAQHILSLHYCESSDELLAGTTYISDCSNTPMKSDACYLLILDPETMEIKSKIKAPKGCSRASVYGNIDESSALISFTMENGTLLGAWNIADGSIKIFEETMETFGACIRPTYFLEIKIMKFMDEAGLFLMKTEDSVILCRATRGGIKLEKTIFDDKDIYMFSQSGESIYAVTPTEIYIADDIKEVGQ